jgi:hypothetical protein
MPEDGPEYGAWRMALGIVAAGALLGAIVLCAGILVVWAAEWAIGLVT